VQPENDHRQPIQIFPGQHPGRVAESASLLCARNRGQGRTFTFSDWHGFNIGRKRKRLRRNLNYFVTTLKCFSQKLSRARRPGSAALESQTVPLAFVTGVGRRN
jgi:hypothetical protein